MTCCNRKRVEDKTPQLYEHFRFVADRGQSLLRVDKFLVDRMFGATRNRIQSAADAGCIMANGKPVKSNYRVKPEDVRDNHDDTASANFRDSP